MATTTTWRGITTDPETARYLTAVAAEVTRMAKAAGVPDFNVTPIPGCGSYQTSTTASAGTHAGGGAVDINAEPLTDAQARILESAARKWGGTAWFRPRTSPTGYVYGWQRHVHILRTDCTDLAAPAATGQVKDYRAGLNGLANKGADTGNRSWVNVTWGAVKNVADTISTIGGAVAGAVNEEDIVATIDDLSKLLDQKLASVLNDNDGQTLRNDVGHARDQIRAELRAQIAGLSSALTALAAGKPIDLDAVTAAAKAGAQAALDEKIAGADVSLNVTR